MGRKASGMREATGMGTVSKIHHNAVHIATPSVIDAGAVRPPNSRANQATTTERSGPSQRREWERSVDDFLILPFTSDFIPTLNQLLNKISTENESYFSLLQKKSIMHINKIEPMSAIRCSLI